MNMANQLKYKEIYSQSINQPDIFWGKAAEKLFGIRNGIRFLTTAKNLFTAGLPEGN